MDKETLRKQIFDEVSAQFDTKLREAKRQKSQVEAELESASERWRAERRRLNSEIDRLESALTEAKESKKKAASKTGHGIDPAEISKIQTAAEEKLKKASEEWQAERAELRKEISRMERALAELLERSNNPLRSAIPRKEQFETKLAEATRAKDQIEEEFRNAQAAWEEEKQRLSTAPVKSARDLEKARRDLEKARSDSESQRQNLAGEISKLREEFRLAQAAWEEEKQRLSAAPVKSARDLEKARRDWESQRQNFAEEISKLREEFRLAQAAWEEEKQRLSAAPVKSARDLEKARSDWESQRQNFAEEISKLREETATVKRHAEEAVQTASHHETSSTSIAQQLREAMQQRHFLEQELAAANETIRSIRAAHAEDQTHLEKQISILEANLERERSPDVDADILEQLRRQYDDRLQEIALEKTQIAEELQHATALLESERNRFAAIPAAAAPPAAGGGDANNTEALNSEITRVESMIAEINRMIDDPSSELSVVIRKNVERAELDAYLKGILFSMGRGGGW